MEKKYLTEMEKYEMYMEEDEIDLAELIGILVKNKLTIFVTTALVSMIALGVAYKARKDGISAQTTIAFDYKGIAEGKNPDGTLFNKDRILSIPVIANAYNQFELNKEYKNNFDVFVKSIKINGIIPNDISTISENELKAGRQFSYTPTQYSISLKLSDIDESKEVLGNIVENSLKKYIEENTPREDVAKINLSQERNAEYDYTDNITIYKNSLNQIKQNITLKGKRGYTSTSLGYSYKNLLTEVNNIENITLSNYISYVDMFRVTRNAEMLKNRYLSKIKILELEKEKTIDSVKVLKDVISAYRPTEKQIILSTAGETGLKLNNVDEYYSNLVTEFKEKSLKISEINSQIKHFKTEILDLKKPTEAQEKYLTTTGEKLDQEINSVIVKLNTLNKNYYSKDYSDLIKVISPVTIVSQSKAMLILAVGIVLGLFLGIFMAFVKEFIAGYKNKKEEK